MHPQLTGSPRRTVTLAFLTTVVSIITASHAAEVEALPDTPTEVITTIGNLPTYHNRNDGFGATSDLLDMSFVVGVEFVEKTGGTRELIWETGAGTVGTSIVYEAPSTIVLRSTGNGGMSLLTVDYTLSAGELAAGTLQLGWTYDVLNDSGTQSMSLIVNGQTVSIGEMDVGGDWSGSDAAKFGNGGGITGTGANGTITAVAFTSGTIDLVKGLEFYADTLWVPVADDTDSDGLPDAWEEIYFPGDLDQLASGQDHDADGFNDELEFAANSDPTDSDTDGDMLTDGREANSAVPGYTATDLLAADTDADGRTDGEEVDGAPSSDPNERDSDNDRFIDGVEVAGGSDPNSFASTPAIGGLLCAYWPLDSVDSGGVSVPDLAGGGLDLEAVNLSGGALVVGRIGNAIAFDAEAETLLCRDSADGEALPISQHQDYTVAMWVNVVGTGQLDLRLFSEGSRQSDTPLFNLGTHSGGADNSLDVFLRNTSGDNGHQRSAAQALDGTWHHLAWVRYGESFELYVDGVLDTNTFDFVNPYVEGLTSTTSIGGIHRALSSHWVTGAIDEVSLWTVALPEAELAELASGVAAHTIVEDGDMDGMPDHWESLNGLDPDDPSDAAGNADLDTLTNLQEYQGGTDPASEDTDGDGLNDDVESNTGMWVSVGDTGTNPRRADSDGDGLGDATEVPDLPYDPDNPTVQPGSDPNLADSDGDQVRDGAEVATGSDPTRSGSLPELEAYFSWCPDLELLGDTYGPDGVIAAVGVNPPMAGLEAQGTTPVVAISESGAAQTGLVQTLDFDGTGYCTITPEPNALRDMLGANQVESDGTLEFYISPDSLTGTNQYIFESGGTGDGHGLVLVGSMLHFGVNSANGAPTGQAIASIDLAPLYASSFNPDDYLLVRANAEPLAQIVLGVTHLRTGLSASDRQPWTGNSWDGGDPLGLGLFQGGRGGDRGQVLSSLPGSSTTWSGFDGQIAKVSAYPGILPVTVSVNTEVFRITSITIDADDMITLEWVSFPDETYSVFSSTDLANFEFEISDGLLSEGARTSFSFPNQQPGEARVYFRVVKQE